QHVAAEGEADDDDAVGGEPAVHAADDCAQIFGAAGVILQPAARSRGAGAAQVETEHGMAALEQVTGARPHVGAGLAAGEAVDEDDERARAVGRARAVEGGDEDVAGAIVEREFEALGRIGLERDGRLAQVVADCLQVAAPPGRARHEPRIGARRIYAVADSQSRTRAIMFSTTRAGAWPTPGTSTTLVAGPRRCISAVVSDSRRSDSAPCSTSTGQRMASHIGQRSTSLMPLARKA